MEHRSDRMTGTSRHLKGKSDFNGKSDETRLPYTASACYHRTVILPGGTPVLRGKLSSEPYLVDVAVSQH